MSRQLAAIMFTDIVGYSALMGEDEQKAFALLKKNRGIQRPLIEKHRGRWLKEMGDGVLASFDAVTDAVYCAKEIQRACQQEEGLKLRIGVHLGEVVFDEGDVFGDGVNIASRLEPLAPIGGILVSESVHKNILNKRDLESKFFKQAHLKNVKEPLRMYQVKVAGSEMFMPDPMKKNASLGQLVFVRRKSIVAVAGVITLLFLAYFFYAKPDGLETVPGNAVEVIDKSIAVLPFVNMSGDPEQEYFSDGMMEEILNHLFKVGGLKLTSRTSAMRYKGSDKSIREIAAELKVAHILEGSVRKSGNEIRITVQLIDANSDIHLWSETYQRELADVFAIQSEVAQQVASALNVRLQPEVIQRIDQIPTNNMEAYDLYLRAQNQQAAVGGNFLVIRELLQQAIELDSNFSTAYAMLGNSIIFQAGFLGDKNTTDIAEQGKTMLEKALLLNPMDGIAHTTMGMYYLWYDKDFNQAEIEFRTGQNLAPSSEIPYDSYIDLLLAAGRFGEAIAIGSKLLEISNDDPVNWPRMALVWAFNNQRERMIECIERADASPSVNALSITEIARSYLVLKQYDRIPESTESLCG